jgi:hypothetical protein
LALLALLGLPPRPLEPLPFPRAGFLFRWTGVAELRAALSVRGGAQLRDFRVEHGKGAKGIVCSDHLGLHMTITL